MRKNDRRAKDLETVERLLMGHSEELRAILEPARRRFRAGEGSPHEQFWQEVETANAAKVTKRRTTRKNGAK